MDRPDLTPETYQVHVIYAVPADQPDRELDIDSTLANSVHAADNFFSDASLGKRIRWDRNLDGTIDVSFLRLPRNDVSYSEQGVFARDEIQADVLAAGFNHSQKIYLVYYDGLNAVTCGGGPPPGSGEQVAAYYLRGHVPGFARCDSQAGAIQTGALYLEWAAVHEVVHALGHVDACAPNHTADRPAHVGDSRLDLMYAGDEIWAPGRIDFNQDDYFGASVPSSCAGNLFLSAFLLPQDGNQLPANFPAQPTAKRRASSGGEDAHCVLRPPLRVAQPVGK